MATIAELTARLDDLHKVRASGIAASQHGDTRLQFRTDAELAAAIADIEQQIAARSGSQTPRRTVASFDRGL